ncbi:hypothetical protein Zmor_026729 [Zophobas morio]|uniref:Uncharacterized protein n=1 Tax=Zophobas morio TaxID=2755281 RepID=A0AA38HUZ7_9CUCU|nr:hypothetical protein Zmor_026729 [Zophobas morio]
MKVLVLVLSLFALFLWVQAQVHYVPAHVLIPTLNISTVQILHNATINNKTEPRNHTGYNNPLLNKTGDQNFNQTNSNGDLIVGKIHPMDHRLFKQIYWKTGRWWSGREKIIQYPADLPGSYGRHETISAIRAFNQFYDGLNSKAELVSGGVGKRFAKIKLSSTWGKGFRYLVVIYGH